MKVEYIGGTLIKSAVFEIGDKGTINDNLQVVWDNGIVSKPLTKENSLIRIINN